MLLLLLNEFYRKAWNNFLTFLQHWLAGNPNEAKINSAEVAHYCTYTERRSTFEAAIEFALLLFQSL